MYSILFVEDDPTVYQMVAQLLDEQGWQVDVCLDGESARQRLHEAQTYHLVITDEELPGVKGLDLVRQLKTITHRRDTPVLMFTSTPCRDEAMLAGVDAFLLKPDDLNALIPTAKRLLTEKFNQPPGATG